MQEAITRTYKLVSFSVVILLIAVVFAGAVTVPAAAAQSTTMRFRYNAQHTGDYSPIAGPVPPNGQKLWSYKTIGYVESSPAVDNGVVYVGSADPYAKSKVYALNATTCALQWSFQPGGRVYCDPAVANGVVYVGNDDGYLYAIGNRTTTLSLTPLTATPHVKQQFTLVSILRSGNGGLRKAQVILWRSTNNATTRLGSRWVTAPPLQAFPAATRST